MKLSEMKQILTERRIQLTKSLGQNFLHDSNQLARILTAAELKETDKILEIGPGLGPLTSGLLSQAGHVLAIEKDARLVEILHQRFASSLNSKLELRQQDALDFLKSEKRDWTAWKVVSNLPYSVASPILVELAQASAGPTRMVVTLQLEVARRLMAGAGGADYGVLTLLVQLNYEPVEWFKIPAGSFFPEPEIDSGCVNLARRSEPLLALELRPVFNKIVKRAFSQRRKMLLKLLKQDWAAERLQNVFQQLDLNPKARGQELSLQHFVALTRQLQSSSL
jgi:16S rRNA (adenine1518-N6/adenine1519-N6)-dimethyltransferase